MFLFRLCVRNRSTEGNEDFTRLCQELRQVSQEFHPQYIFREKTAHQAEAAPSAVIQAVSKQSALNGLLVVIR